MPELEIIEAKVPVRTPRLVREPDTMTSGSTPLATWFNGPVFSRARDIFAANMTELLDRSEDPARMIRMIILEMEETLVHIRASAARSIADGKEMRRSLKRLDELQASWTEKAEMALSKGRQDLAKAALFERQSAADMADGLKDEIAVIDDTLGDEVRVTVIAAGFDGGEPQTRIEPITASRVVSAPAVPALPADEAAKDRDAEPVPVGASLPESSYDSAFGDDDLDIPDFLK